MDDTKSLYGRPTEEQYAEMIRPTLTAFEEASGPIIKRITDSIYECLLEGVQDYLRQNVEWNLGNDIRRADRISRENEALSSALEAAQAEIERLRDALQRINDWREHHGSTIAVDHGSNGVRDYYRMIAIEALKGERMPSWKDEARALGDTHDNG